LLDLEVPFGDPGRDKVLLIRQEDVEQLADEVGSGEGAREELEDLGGEVLDLEDLRDDRADPREEVILVGANLDALPFESLDGRWPASILSISEEDVDNRCSMPADVDGRRFMPCGISVSVALTQGMEELLGRCPCGVVALWIMMFSEKSEISDAESLTPPPMEEIEALRTRRWADPQAKVSRESSILDAGGCLPSPSLDASDAAVLHTEPTRLEDSGDLPFLAICCGSSGGRDIDPDRCAGLSLVGTVADVISDIITARRKKCLM